MNVSGLIGYRVRNYAATEPYEGEIVGCYEEQVFQDREGFPAGTYPTLIILCDDGFLYETSIHNVKVLSTSLADAKAAFVRSRGGEE